MTDDDVIGRLIAEALAFTALSYDVEDVFSGGALKNAWVVTFADAQAAPPVRHFRVLVEWPEKATYASVKAALVADLRKHELNGL